MERVTGPDPVRVVGLFRLRREVGRGTGVKGCIGLCGPLCRLGIDLREKAAGENPGKLALWDRLDRERVTRHDTLGLTDGARSPLHGLLWGDLGSCDPGEFGAKALALAGKSVR